MKLVILAGGLGTRLTEETILKPKPMIEIGGYPILWHIMKYYSCFNINDFIICCGYKGFLIKEFFLNYFYHTSDLSIDLTTNTTTIHQKNAEPWKITLVDTGSNTMTGGRLKRIRKYLDDEDDFCMTYGDGLSNINISDLIIFHTSHKKIATISGVEPPGRFGALDIHGDKVLGFREKPKGDGSLINGGFFVLKNKSLDYIDNDNTIWEKGPLENLSKDSELNVFKHSGFWQPMDTLREKNLLEDLWVSGKAPWKIW